MEFDLGHLIYNTSSGKIYNLFYLNKILNYFKKLNVEIVLKKSNSYEELKKKAEESLKEGAKFIGVLGGDGTVRGIGSILVNTGVPLLIIPFGTSNVLAYSLNISLNPLAAVKIFEKGKISKIDSAKANERYFFYVASTGIDAKVMQSQRVIFKKIFGRYYFFPHILKNLVVYNYPEIIIESEEFTEKGYYTAISNVPYFAGKYKLFEEAQPNDEFLDLIILKEKGIKNYIKLFINLKKKKVKTPESFLYSKIKYMEIKSKEEVPYQLDGDFKGYLPLKIKVVEKSLSLFLP